MMRRPAGFDADPRRRQLLKELNNLPPPQLLAQHRLLGRIHTMQLKNTLGRVHSNADKIVHGRPPCLRSTTTSFWHIDAVGGRPPQQPLVFVVTGSRRTESLERQNTAYGSRPSPGRRRRIRLSNSPTVIASGAKQSILAAQRKNGLLRYARNDGVT